MFRNMDGLRYIERHLGYRFWISDVQMEYSFLPSDLRIIIELRNEGFAPIYYEPKCALLFRNRETSESSYVPIKTDLCSLAGGVDSDSSLKITNKITLAGYEAGEYDIYFEIIDSKTDCSLILANEQEITDHGYLLGSLVVGAIKNPFNGEPLEEGKELGLWLEEWRSKYDTSRGN